jgi:hypothetical protein
VVNFILDYLPWWVLAAIGGVGMMALFVALRSLGFTVHQALAWSLAAKKVARIGRVCGREFAFLPWFGAIVAGARPFRFGRGTSDTSMRGIGRRAEVAMVVCAHDSSAARSAGGRAPGVLVIIVACTALTGLQDQADGVVLANSARDVLCCGQFS